MHAGLHAAGWGLQRLSIGLVAIAFAALLAYAGLVFVIVAVQAIGAFGQ